MLERNLTRLLRQLRIGDSLLFLNKMLAVARGELDDPPTRQAIDRSCPKGVPAFVVHLITKYLLQYGRMNTPVALDWTQFPRVLDCAFQLAIADPISDSGDDAVRGYFVRMMAQQMHRHKPMQCYGLAVALFQDVDAITGPKPYDLRTEVEATIKMPVEVFMRIGQAAHAATCATFEHTRLRGTLDLGWLKKAAEDIPEVPWLEKWPDFAAAVAITPQGLGELVDAKAKAEGVFPAYAFNPLRRRPVILVDAARYVAVNPWLLVNRTSLGVFYDLFEPHVGNQRAVRDFTSNFGQPFELLVGNLLEASLPPGTVWKESASALAKASRTGPAPQARGLRLPVRVPLGHDRVCGPASDGGPLRPRDRRRLRRGGQEDLQGVSSGFRAHRRHSGGCLGEGGPDSRGLGHAGRHVRPVRDGELDLLPQAH